MSQNPLIYSGTQFSKTPSLKPALVAALASLEVQLDRELARYRRTRNYRTSSQANLGSSTANNQLQYLNPANVDMYGDVTPVEESHPHMVDTAQNPYQMADREIARTEVKTPTGVSELTSSPLPLPPPPPPQTPKSAAVSIEDPTSTPTMNPPQNTVSIVPAAAKVTVESNQNTADSQTSKSQPDDYLESSEALLRSLTEEPLKEQKRPNSNDSLLSPLGIGSMLLLIVAASILGVVVINPKSLQFSQDSSSKANNSTAETQGGTTTTTKNVVEPAQTPIPKYPNLAKEEFPEVNNPNDVVGLKPKSKPTPTVATSPPVLNSPVVNPQQQVPSIPINPASPPTTITPPVAVTPPVSSTPTPTPEIPLSEIQASADGFYHVVIDNGDPNTLATARKAVPDAYLSPDGKLVYLGAIKNKEKATVLLAEIKAKGINARIRQP